MKKTLLSLAVIIATTYYSNGQSYLPLSAGSGYPLTGTLYSNTVEGIRLSGNNVYLSAFDNAGSIRTGFLQFNPSGPIILGADHATAIALIGTNVGIGTTTPLQPLQVNGNVSALAASGPTNSYFTFQRSSDGYTGAQIGNVYEFSAYKGSMVFETNNGGGATSLSEAMRINSAGNVGIGTTSPDQKLTVNGTIHSREVKVDLSVPGPDYVFEPGYKLVDLSELEAYVAKNHHLPGIPSAGQMAREGLNLGEMNTRLLKKVEELTLYLLDQQKQLKKQANRIKTLEKKFN